MKLQSSRGTRDFLPEEKIVRQEIVAGLRSLFELYGFSPLETPIIESYETLASKYAGGAEILKETFSFEDQGKRKLGLRYDLTVPFARVIAMNPMLKKPFKRYEIGPVFRDGPIKLGRYRQFDQCDVDVVGSSSLLADAELLSLAASFFSWVRLDVTIFVNNRKVLNALIAAAGIPKKFEQDAILSLDKVKKIGVSGVRDELVGKGVARDAAEKLLSSVDGCEQLSNAEVVDRLTKFVSDTSGCEEIREVLEYCEVLQVPRVRFDPSLARGLSYYTGTVFEVFADDSEITSSLAAGGRYDEMIGKLAGSAEPLPAVGMSFGIEPILEAVKAAKMIAVKKSVAKVFVVPIKTVKESLGIVSELRQAGIPTDIDLVGRSISKNLDFANAYEIPFVIIVGQKELAEGKVTLKNMVLGEEKLLALHEVVDTVSR